MVKRLFFNELTFEINEAWFSWPDSANNTSEMRFSSPAIVMKIVNISPLLKAKGSLNSYI